jgi:DNA polymerase-3 subunit alpha
VASGLVFERFLNIERKEMPDIDLDFQDDRRDEVIAYVSKKYGLDHVAQIITFGTLGARAAIRDVGRALGMSYGDVDRVARLVPFQLGVTLDRALSENLELKAIYDQDAIVKKLVDSARRVEGIARHASTHAAGVVISKEPLTNYVPLLLGTKVNEQASVMTQFAMGDIAQIGLLKMDLLGLANLTVLGKAQEVIRENNGVDIDLPKIPMDDNKTFALLSAGETTGVFQLEGAGMRRYIKELKPTTFTDIAAMVALYRPGPMEHIPTFIKAKHGEEQIRYPHPALENFLKETYGVIVYQDQVLFIVRAFAGYSLGQADIFRKAMGKKIPEIMKKERRNFLEGAKKNGYSAELAEQIFALIEPFAGYAFNKAHSFSYALIAYQTAYLKANYPAEYIAAFLAIHMGVLEKIATAVAECRRLGITVLPPDINHSRVNFAIEKQGGRSAIRFGLAAIKNVGPGAIEPVIAEREKGGPFKSVEDFCRRCDLRGINRRVVESLVKVGVFDSLGINRGTLLNNINRVMGLAQREQRLRETGQSTMFDLFGGVAAVPMPGLELEPAEVSLRERLGWEKELTGVYLSEHPFSSVAGSFGSETTLCGQIDAELEGQVIGVAGMVAQVSNLFTRDHKPFVSAMLEDLSGQIEVIVWPRVYQETATLWVEGNILLVEGKVRVREDRVQVQCDKVSLHQPSDEPAPAKPPPAPVTIHRLTVTLRQTEDKPADTLTLRKTISLLKDYPGKDEVKLEIMNGEKNTVLRLPKTAYCSELHQRLSALVGEDALVVESFEI